MSLRAVGQGRTQPRLTGGRLQSHRSGARLAPQVWCLGASIARDRFLVGLIFLVFFVISLLTNILGPIVPDIISSFSIGMGAAGFLVFAFFIAYGVMSIPAGFLVERYREKPVMIG